MTAARPFEAYRMILIGLLGMTLGLAAWMAPRAYETVRLYLLPGTKVEDARLLDHQIDAGPTEFRDSYYRNYWITYAYGTGLRSKRMEVDAKTFAMLRHHTAVRVRVVEDEPAIAALELERPARLYELAWAGVFWGLSGLLALALWGFNRFGRRYFPA